MRHVGVLGIGRLVVLLFRQCIAFQQTDRQSALQTSQKEKNDRIPFTLTFHPHNNPVKPIILKRECPRRPRGMTKMWHMLEKLISLIFRPEIPHDDLINVIYFFC